MPNSEHKTNIYVRVCIAGKQIPIQTIIFLSRNTTKIVHFIPVLQQWQ